MNFYNFTSGLNCFSFTILLAILSMVADGSAYPKDILTYLTNRNPQSSNAAITPFINVRERRRAQVNNGWMKNDYDYQQNEDYNANDFSERGDVFYWNDPPVDRVFPSRLTTTSTTTSRPRPIPQIDARLMEDCRRSCFISTVYNPVCGNDKLTYRNPTSLNCWSSCGTPVSILYYGNCITTNFDRPQPSRLEVSDIIRSKDPS